MARIVTEIHDLVAASKVVDVDRSGGGRGRKSDLTRFFENEDAVGAITAMTLNGHSWSAVAVFLSAQGIKDGVGQSPSGGRVRRAYWLARQSPLAPEPLTKNMPAVRNGAEVRVSPSRDGRKVDIERRPPRKKLVFQQATALICPESDPMPAPTAETPNSAAVDTATALAKIADVMSDMERRSPSLPKIVDTQR